MIIEHISLDHFRNYNSLSVYPHESVNLLFGPNGSGKTNLLESIHYCSLGRSHRITGDSNVIQTGSDFARCRISVKSGLNRKEIIILLNRQEGSKKVIQIDGKRIPRFSELMGCLQCVIFSPEDLGLILQGPSFRRRYLDMMISQLNRNYFIALQQYRTAMEQRNSILRNLRYDPFGDSRMLDVFENSMASSGAVIVDERIKMISLISQLSENTYSGISGRDDEILHVSYHSSLKDASSVQDEMIKQLRESRPDDIKNGFSSCGPHRDDLYLSLNKKPMKQYASQGQIRTAALSLKLAQMKALTSIGGDRPVLLLDDVMSELDRGRRTRLISEIGDYQTFITCTDESDFEYNGDKRTFNVAVSLNGDAALLCDDPSAAVFHDNVSEPDFS